MRKDGIKKFILCPVLLAYPMLNVTRGLSALDTTYSPGNFRFHDIMDGTWIVATYLANALGRFFTLLPYGDTLLGLNIYTSLLVGLTAVMVFLVFSDRFGCLITFAGELMAISLCWCPTTILYNYLTYFLMTAGVLFLYKALCTETGASPKASPENETRGPIGRRELYLLAAGFILGSNVLTRLPNVTECLFILVLWAAGLFCKTGFKKVLVQTLYCIAGYIAGFALGFGIICARFGTGAYSDMIKALSAMTDTAVDYKPLAMIEAFISDYIYAARWIALWIGAFVVCAVLYLIMKKLTENGAVQIVYYIVCALVFALVIRICYGQGMFSFRYYEYGSMYFWAVLALFVTTLICILDLIRGDTVLRIEALIVLLIIYVTCIGSNNGLYPSVNNMFVILPYLLYHIKRNESLKEYGAVNAGLIILSVCLAVQGVGFYLNFSFDDGIDGAARDSYVTGYDRTAHIKTTAQHAKDLQGLMDFMYVDRAAAEGGTNIKADNHDAVGESLILYGDIPGMGFILDMPSAISTFWPDLDSYNYYEWENDLNILRSGSDRIPSWDKREIKPYIIVTLPVAACIEGDADAVAYFGADTEEYSEDAKLNDLKEFVSEYDYGQVYANDAYVVYKSR